MARIFTEVEVEVDLDEFNLSEILDEINDRYDNNRGKDKARIDEFVNGFYTHENTSLLDEMKMDFLKRNLNKISLNDLENLI